MTSEFTFVPLVMADHAVAGVPEQAPQTGAAPDDEVRHRVPLDPVGVVVSVEPFQKATPLSAGEDTDPPANGVQVPGFCRLKPTVQP